MSQQFQSIKIDSVKQGNKLFYGLQNIKTQTWLIPPQYKQIQILDYFKVSPNLFSVKTFSNKHGVVNKHNKLILDTAYLSEPYGFFEDNLSTTYWLFNKKDNNTILLNSYQEIIYDPQIIFQIMIENLWANQDSIQNIIYSMDSKLQISLYNSLIQGSSHILAPIHYYHLDYCDEYVGWDYTIENISSCSYRIRITHTINRNNGECGLGPSEKKYQFQNKTFCHKKVKTVEWNDLFEKEHQYYDEFNHFLSDGAKQNAKFIFDINGIKLSAFYPQIKENFALDSKGLTTTFNMNSSYTYTVTIPWKSLVKYPKAKELSRNYIFD
jgi:hypothetical protein